MVSTDPLKNNAVPENWVDLKMIITESEIIVYHDTQPTAPLALNWATTRRQASKGNTYEYLQHPTALRRSYPQTGGQQDRTILG